MNWNFSAFEAALSSILKIALTQWRRDNKKVITMKRVVAKSKPIRNLVSRSCAGPSTTPSSTVFSSPETFGTKDHEMRFETRTEKPSSNNQQESIIKRDRVTNSQERFEEARSRSTTGSPMTRKPSQTEDLTTCTGHPVPTIESWRMLAVAWRRISHSFCPFNLIQRTSGWEAAFFSAVSSRR